MSEKRRDKKGRILRTGESQRKDLMYQYRYTDAFGKRKTVYASDLNGLREKEKKIQQMADKDVDYAAGKISVIDMMERYVKLKQNVRYHTKESYRKALNTVKKEEFGRRPIRDIKTSDAKMWILKLHEDGKGYSTIASLRNVVKPALDMAYEEEIIQRNPFDFRLKDVIPNDSKKRAALTGGEQEAWLHFVRNDRTYSRYYDEVIVLLGTGVRISEFCGLTKDDLDFKTQRIRVDHQLGNKKDGTLYIEKPKTKSGVRYIPMSKEVRQSLQSIMEKRRKPEKEYVVDGYSGFLLLTRIGKPKTSYNMEQMMQRMMNKYQMLHPEKPLPKITPHVLRHTFCTNMANSGIDAKSLQYLMGHSDVGVTLNVYTHMDYERAEEQMKKALQSREADMEAGKR